jgi:hypothetical protein
MIMESIPLLGESEDKRHEEYKKNVRRLNHDLRLKNPRGMG